jgi:hypothetical protein
LNRAENETIEGTKASHEVRIDQIYEQLRLKDLDQLVSEGEVYRASVSQLQIVDAIQLLDRMMANIEEGYQKWRAFIQQRSSTSIQRQTSRTIIGATDLTDLQQISLLTSDILLRYDAVGDYILRLQSQLSLLKGEKIPSHIAYVDGAEKTFRGIQGNLQIAVNQLISILQLNSNTKLYVSTERLLLLTKLLLCFTLGVLGLTALGILFGLIHF